jgi:vacuolar protein sorting-associated protein 29
MSSGGSFTDFGELILLVGDLEIPGSKPTIPSVFRELLNTDKIKTVLCTGNVGSDAALEELEKVSQNFHAVRGDIDGNIFKKDLTDQLVVTIGQFKIGLIHGHQILPCGDRDAMTSVQRKLDVDILVSGSTCINDIFQRHGKFFLNPGSLTGCVSSTAAAEAQPTPSFMLMAVQGHSAIVYVYELVDGKANVSLSEFTKQS